ncbi:hypothetical protein [Glycomyces algeriensis]|uniref:Uncharacterized protein n=1 Tax=Glycomyces algeriensis TaxID=256037 RepID=A0A9W6G516_9ACTN|nr:hypothetical protein [Glycomyces algeriensis]MDA1366834.1 hypothetical protein [Glycomyces algeriensis]MDR7352781.1 hypothetical protein [Glycomyces algeriensis]GLI40464.1 hypothetical protein GALLR39Z86_03140 [Glycomyces algeriensis]
MTAPTGSPEPVRPQIRLVVRANRFLCISVAAIGLPSTFVLIMFDPGGINSTADDLTRAAGFASFNLAFWCLVLLFRRWYFTFDARNRAVTASGRWKARGTYPSRRFDRIEYSVYDARIYEVRADGKRRRLPVRRWLADQQDWRALVDLLLAAKQPAPTSRSPQAPAAKALRTAPLDPRGPALPPDGAGP